LQITKSQLAQIIKEELQLVLESYPSWPASADKGAGMVPPKAPAAGSSWLHGQKKDRLRHEIKQFWLDKGAKGWQAAIKAGIDNHPGYGELSHEQIDRANKRMKDKENGGNGEIFPGEPMHFGLEQGSLYGME
jgi:hypothetical protein